MSQKFRSHSLLAHDGGALAVAGSVDAALTLASRLVLSPVAVECAARLLLDHLLERPAPRVDGDELALEVLLRLANDKGAQELPPVADERLTVLLNYLVKEPETTVAGIEFLSDAERAILLAQGCGPANPYQRTQRIEKIVAAHAHARPASIAIIDGANSVSYAELMQRAEDVAGALRNLGLGQAEPVAIILPRSMAQVTAALGVLCAAGVYVPVDPELPAERITFLLEDSGARAVIAFADRAVLAAGYQGPILMLDACGRPLTAPFVRAECVRSARVELVEVDPCASAYIMYTSGTTGRPKGVPVPHRGVARLVLACDYVQLSAATVMLHSNAIGFDSTILETWGALMNGGVLCVADRDTLLDTAAFARLLRMQGVNTAVLTPALFTLHAESNPASFAQLKQLILGGDRFPVVQAQRVAQACPQLVFINCYGPTENAVVSVAGRIAALDCESVPLGRPIANSTALVMNRDGHLLPANEIGELWVGGDGLGPGYLNRPDLSAKAFCPHPYAPEQNLYRTGDLASLDIEGQIWFHGRRDQQVKIRGQRIELGEIESELARQAGVSAAVVVVQAKAVGDPMLIAFCTGVGGLNGERLRRALASELPTAAIPAMIEVLDDLPLNANGKLDRIALSERASGLLIQTQAACCAGSGDDFAALVTQALGRKSGDLAQSFAGLGGSSLDAVRLARLVEARLGMRCTPGDVLSAPTLAVLHAQLLCAGQAASGLSRGAAVEKPCPASGQQAAFYVEQIKAPDSTAYNLPIVIEFESAPEPDLLRSSLALLVARYPLLRARFTMGDDGVQMIVEPCLERLPFDIVETAPGAAKDIADFVHPFDPGRAACWRAVLLNGPRPQLLFDIHHILCDGHALVLLLCDWSALYRGETLPAPAYIFHDWLTWRAGSEARAAQGHQLEAARAALSPLPAAPALPTDRVRHGARGWAGRHRVFLLKATRARAVEALARALDVTAFSVLFGAYALWFTRTTGSTDFVVGVPALGRAARGSEEVFGPLVNTAHVRLRVDAGHDVTAHLQAVASAVLCGLAYQDVPPAELTRALVAQSDPRRNSLFDGLFAYQDGGLEGLAALGGRARWLPEATRATLFDLNLQIEQAGDDLRATWAASTELFDPATLESFCDGYVRALDAILDRPDASLADLLEIPRVKVNLPNIDFAF